MYHGWGKEANEKRFIFPRPLLFFPRPPLRGVTKGFRRSAARTPTPLCWLALRRRAAKTRRHAAERRTRNGGGAADEREGSGGRDDRKSMSERKVAVSAADGAELTAIRRKDRAVEDEGWIRDFLRR